MFVFDFLKTQSEAGQKIERFLRNGISYIGEVFYE